jgi:hypothetical protein
MMISGSSGIECSLFVLEKQGIIPWRSKAE